MLAVQAVAAALCCIQSLLAAPAVALANGSETILKPFGRMTGIGQGDTAINQAAIAVRQMANISNV